MSGASFKLHFSWPDQNVENAVVHRLHHIFLTERFSQALTFQSNSMPVKINGESLQDLTRQ